MRDDVLVDSWAWVEFFQGSHRGVQVKEIMRGKNLYASVLTLSEVSFWCTRNQKNPKPCLQVIKRNATVLKVDERIAEIAGQLLFNLRKKSPGMGLIDAIVYSQGIVSNIPVLTGDPDFRGLDGVEFIE